MHFVTRIEYDPYIPLSEQTDNIKELTSVERLQAELEARSQHLLSLGFVLSQFNPYKMTIGDDEAIALQNYGALIQQIAQGLFSPTDELQTLIDAATTFENCTAPP